MSDISSSSLREIAKLFLKLGFIGFGGPAAHIGLMENEIVRRRKWLTHEEFLDLIGATNLIPGPNSTEIAIHVGRLRAGWKGLIVAGCCFLLPAFFIVLALAWIYVRYGDLPQIEAALYGIKPVIIAIVVQALWSLTRKGVKNYLLGFILAMAIGANACGMNELVVLIVGGLVAAIFGTPDIPWIKKRKSMALLLLFSVVFLTIVLFWIPRALTGGTGNLSQSALFYYFLKIGSVMYGSGYVLLAFLQGDMVDKLQWLTPQQLLDAIAVGQATPGPLFTSATFIGYLLSSYWGAVLATLGIFLPSFIFVAASGPLIPRIRRSAIAGVFLDGVNAASLALMAVVAFELGKSAIIDWLTLVLAALSAVLLVRYRVNSLWLILLGIVAGLLQGLIF